MSMRLKSGSRMTHANGLCHKSAAQLGIQWRRIEAMHTDGLGCKSAAQLGIQWRRIEAKLT